MTSFWAMAAVSRLAKVVAAEMLIMDELMHTFAPTLMLVITDVGGNDGVCPSLSLVGVQNAADEGVLDDVWDLWEGVD